LPGTGVGTKLTIPSAATTITAGSASAGTFIYTGAGIQTITTTADTAKSIILITLQNGSLSDGSSALTPYISARVPGTSFSINTYAYNNGVGGNSTSTVRLGWLIVN
jgi:hypothetical protein